MEFFLFTTASKLVLGSIQPPIQWVPRLKRLGRDADQLRVSSTEVKSYITSEFYPYVFLNKVSPDITP